MKFGLIQWMKLLEQDINLVAPAIHQVNKEEYSMKVTIDRFEGDFAVVELADMTFVNMPIQLVPEGAKEGDILSIEVDKKKTNERKKRIEKLMDDLWE